jgi:hypothetical protein
VSLTEKVGMQIFSGSLVLKTSKSYKERTASTVAAQNVLSPCANSTRRLPASSSTCHDTFIETNPSTDTKYTPY